MRTVFYVPPLKRTSGGLANIGEIAADILSLGGDAALMGPNPPGVFAEEARKAGLGFIPWGEKLDPLDLWCVPESWPSSLGPGLQCGARILVYVQSWSFMLGDLPGGVPWSALSFSFLSVSRPVRAFLRMVHGIEAEDILPPAVDEAFFEPSDPPRTRVRIAWSPRKNKSLGAQIRAIAERCLRHSAIPVEWVELSGMSREEVARRLRSCQIFLSTGFPEGFGLLPLEAMASGCVPVGFSGFGGWDYMRQARLPGWEPYRPPLDLPDWGEDGNGFFFADGDVMGAGLGLAGAVRLLLDDPGYWARIGANCRATALRYARAARLPALARVFLQR
ncbi:MAG: glycosyltransferase family 1 protein [Desulfovibrio sp.]|jgi:glycosyltransferase involved in cell wall biosynthesis|nr:glycosyltransferase family 1 protein [Desulfovibrio sp.]